MRRKDKEITDINEKLNIIDKNKVCRLGLCNGDQPYVVPMNFGYTYENDTLTLYFHGANEGTKIEIFKKNNKACFEIDCNHKLIEADDPCKHSFAYESIIGFGHIYFIEKPDEKTHGLNILMKHQTGKNITYSYTEQDLNRVTIYKMTVTSFTGKHKEVPPPQN